MPSAAPTARLEARISTELHAMLKRVAEIQGRSLTDFVVIAVQEAAQRAIEQGEVVRLSLADSERFAQALLSPPDPSPFQADRYPANWRKPWSVPDLLSPIYPIAKYLDGVAVQHTHRLPGERVCQNRCHHQR